MIAARAWDEPMEETRVPPARPGSWEEVLHDAGSGDTLLIFDRARQPEDALVPRGHRAIGVVYHPELEQYGNYVQTVLPRRYDALLFVDESHALRPLHFAARAPEEAPETFPAGM